VGENPAEYSIKNPRQLLTGIFLFYLINNFCFGFRLGVIVIILPFSMRGDSRSNDLNGAVFYTGEEAG
jgi:hypothetical protein